MDETPRNQMGVSRRQMLGSVTGAAIVGVTGVSSATDRESKSRFVETGLYLDIKYGSKETGKYPAIYNDKPIEYRVKGGGVATSEL